MTRTALLLAAIALLSGCGNSSIPTGDCCTRPAALEATRASTASIEKDLATLRSVTATFQDTVVSQRAGWSALITGCMTSSAGGMGFHYGKPSIIDATSRVDQPELLLYEPQDGGRLRLVAVEYIVPYTAHERSAAPPVLFGQQFKRNDVFQLWGLHVWVWKNNPSGLFADWNPNVGCGRQTVPASPMSL